MKILEVTNLREGSCLKQVGFLKGSSRKSLTEKWPIRRGESIQDFWKRLKKNLDN
jgi:hypothetical protein